MNQTYNYCEGEAGEDSIVEYSQSLANKIKPQLCPVNLVNDFMECHHHFFFVLLYITGTTLPQYSKDGQSQHNLSNCSFYRGLYG